MQSTIYSQRLVRRLLLLRELQFVVSIHDLVLVLTGTAGVLHGLRQRIAHPPL